MDKNEFMELMNGYITEGFYDWLVENKFFVMPASTKYHGNHEGGLFAHSKEVMNQLIFLTNHLGLEWSLDRSPYIIGMFHDICKTDNYILEGGIWKYNPNQILTGHGDKSVILLQRYMKLTEEEILCIRWHMGAFDDKDNWNAYGLAIEKYPNVLYSHTADMMASRIVKI